MSWWKRLFGSRKQPMPPTLGDLYIAPRSDSVARVEAVLPETDDLPRLLELVPPPLVSEHAPNLDSERDFAPDPVASYAITWPARQRFTRRDFSDALTRDLRQSLGQPTLYARLPSGRVTFLTSGGDETLDPLATAIIAAWDLAGRGGNAEEIGAWARAMAQCMASRPEGFASVLPDAQVLKDKWRRAQAIVSVRPEHVAIVAVPRRSPLDGRMVWRTLHAIGIEWGDMDQFQWVDPTSQTDYLFWAEVDDGNIGYALPELIASGAQHFIQVRFIFDIARCPAPVHVLAQMKRAAEVFADTTGCELHYAVDGRPVASADLLDAAVADCVQQLTALGVMPGSSSVCILR